MRVMGTKSRSAQGPRTKVTSQPRGVSAPRNPPKESVQHLGEHFRTLIKQSGLTQVDVAIRAGVNASQFSQFLQGQAGLGLAKTQAVARVLHHGLVSPGGPGVDVGGIVVERGLLHRYEVSMPLPVTVRLDAQFDRFGPGDIIHIEPCESWETGSTLLVRHLDGTERLYVSVEDAGLRLLRDALGDELRYVPERHQIIGVVTSATVIVRRGS